MLLGVPGVGLRTKETVICWVGVGVEVKGEFLTNNTVKNDTGLTVIGFRPNG